MSFFAFFRKFTAPRVKRSMDDDDDEELHPLQETVNHYSSSCYSLHQACLLGDAKAVRWYIEHRKEDINKPGKKGELPLFNVIQKNNVVLMKDLINAGADVNLMIDLEEGTNVASTHVAAKYNSCDCMKILLDHGADPNVRNLFGQAPLHVAARRKFNDVAKLLLEIGKADVNIADNDNVTPLHLAATTENEKERKLLTKTLLSSGANPFSQDNEGNTAFHEAAENGVDDVMEILFEYRGCEECIFSTISDVLNKPRNDGYNCLHLAVENGHEKVIQRCIDRKADVNLKTFNDDTPLHIACTRGHLYACKMLLDNGANLEAGDRYGRMAICRAAEKGHVKCLAYLIEKGTNIDVYHRHGTALLAAARSERTEAVKFLLEAGASPTIRDHSFDTCLHLAVKNGDEETVKVIMEKCGQTLLELKDRYEKTALHHAAAKENPEVLKILLSHNPDIIARDDKGKSPIHISAENGRTECSRHLMNARKCSIHLTDFMWRTPLHYSCFCPNLDLINLLLENGADVNARDDKRWTPLMYVAYLGCPCSAQVLVEHGAKMDLWDKNRMTALTIAASQNNNNAVKTLLTYDADPTIPNCDGLNCLDVAIQNRFHDVCITIAQSDKWREAIISNKTMEDCLESSPEAAKIILDKCIEYSGREIDTDYKVTYHFDLLDPDPANNESYYGPLVMKMAGRNELLTHPLTKKLLEVNWRNGVRLVYYVGMFLVAVALVFFVMFLTHIKMLYEECYTIADQNSTSPLELLLHESYCSLEVSYDHNFMAISRVVICGYFIIYITKEFFQLYVERWEYFTEISNFLDIAGSVLFLIFIGIPSRDIIPFQKYNYGIIGIFIFFFLMFLWMRGFPRYGIYITMFLEVLGTLIQVIFGFTILFLGFSATFFLTFFQSTEFKSFRESLLKVMAMVMGELDYSVYRENVNNLPSDLQFPALSIFILFCFTMTMVVNNLLIGLAVGDIEAVQKTAEIKQLSLRVNHIVEARTKIPLMFRRRYYVQKITEMPNTTDCVIERRRLKKEKKRKENKATETRKAFENILNVSAITKTERNVYN